MDFELDFEKNSQSYLLVCFQLGKALRFGHVDYFLKVYDQCLEHLENNEQSSEQLENIKELSRNLSDLPESQFCVFEQAYKEGLLVNEQSLNLMEVLASLSLKLHCNTSDSGIYSDDAEPCQKPKNKCDNRSSYMVHQQPCSIDKPTSQVVNSVKTDASQNAETLIGTYMYSEGSLIKLKSVKPRSRSDQYKYCVQFLFKRWIEVQKEQNYRR